MINIKTLRYLLFRTCHLLTIFGRMTSELAVLPQLLTVRFLCPRGFALVTSVSASFGNVTFSLCWWSPHLLLQVGFWPGEVKKKPTKQKKNTGVKCTAAVTAWWSTRFDTNPTERMRAARWDNAASSAASCALCCKRLRCCRGSVSVQLWGLDAETETWNNGREPL